MFATLAGGYPTGPLPGLADAFGEARRRRASRMSDDATYAAAADAFVAEIVAEQVAARISMVSDGHVRWPDGIDSLADGMLDGTIGPLDVAAAWRAVADVGQGLPKQMLPGPYSTARARAATEVERRSVAARFEDALDATIGELAAAGCGAIQIDEPAATALGSDADAWSTFASEVGRVGATIPEAVHGSLALPDGAVDPAGHAAIADLPFEGYLVDALAGPDTWRLIDAIPGDRGIICGVADIHMDRARDDPEMMVWAATLAAESNDRGAARVGIAPNGDLAPLGRFVAKRKLWIMSVALHVAAVGPLSEVARALHEDPSKARIPALRRIVADHAEAHGRRRTER